MDDQQQQQKEIALQKLDDVIDVLRRHYQTKSLLRNQANREQKLEKEVKRLLEEHHQAAKRSGCEGKSPYYDKKREALNIAIDRKNLRICELLVMYGAVEDEDKNIEIMTNSGMQVREWIKKMKPMF